ncbi:deoxyribonuclease II family protein [Trichinella spiralis]|uniref:deoxyribonuclease II family protein n=1 Tax=Trichinella spiralis TaxID=6334 RepID=UPI0001EFCF48|nr:deoxyribonuclease II family protein [Trichinella spiralis]
MQCKQVGGEKLPFSKVGRSSKKAIVYKAPGQNTGKIIFATAAGAWDDGAQPLSNVNQHSFAKALEHVVADNNNIKFLAYNNAPPGVPSVKTKSNSKEIFYSVMILSTAANSAAWIVHTVPGFPTAKTPYSWPVAENARGHLLICLTISKSQINAIAASLLLVQPMVHYNDIPETETAGMPYFNKLAGGKIPTLPPFTSRRSIRTENAGGPVAVHIYSKSESSKYGDCRGSQRHIRLIKSPAAINGHNTNLEADITNWAISDPGNIFCHIDKPYFKNQTREPAMAICIENNEIFARFNEIAAQFKDISVATLHIYHYFSEAVRYLTTEFANHQHLAMELANCQQLASARFHVQATTDCCLSKRAALKLYHEKHGGGETELSTSHDASTPSSVADKDSLEGRRCKRVKTLEEAKDAIAISSQVINPVVPPLANGDSGSDDSDIEYQPDDLKDTFDPAVQLEVEGELDMDEFVDIKLAQKKAELCPSG